MLDNETYQQEVIRMWDSLRDDNHKGRKDCYKVECRECPLCSICNNTKGEEDKYNAFEFIEAVEKWSKEHPKHYYVSQLEYDILKSFIDDTKFVYYFYDSDLLMSLLKKGYFQGANNDTDIYEYIENCMIKGEK